MTPDFAKHSISPESSDGFASVGTILPKEEATLLPGGLFVCMGGVLSSGLTTMPDFAGCGLSARMGEAGRCSSAGRATDS